MAIFGMVIGCAIVGWQVYKLRTGAGRDVPRRRVPAGRGGRMIRALGVGDRIASRPCLVTIERVTDRTAYGYCEACEDSHIIDRTRYEAGAGPWNPSLTAKRGRD